ncbi:MAG TPA: hypothetical protein QGF58_02065 [Myxococcota bacterium]|nr:hypothetical protein [Myxococcota bacterium]
MILLLAGLARGSEPSVETTSPYQLGYHAGYDAAEAKPRGRPGLVGFAAGFGTAALGTTLVGPCLASPCIVAGAMSTSVAYSIRGPSDSEDGEQTWQYSNGYRHGWTDATLPKRIRPALLGGVAGAIVGTGAAYLAVGFAYQRIGYEVDTFPFNRMQ